MEFLTLKSFFGEHLNHVVFTGGTAIALICQSENFPFRRRTNDIDTLVKFNSPEKIKLEAHLASIPHAIVGGESETDIAQYVTIGRYHIDLLKESLLLLPPETISVQGEDVQVSSKADIAGTKLARFVYNLSARSGSEVIHDLLDTAILNEISSKDLDNYPDFLEKACLVFSTRIAPYRVDYNEGLSLLEQLPQKRSELKEMMVVTDKESPLFGLDERSFDNIINSFYKFIKQASKQLESRSSDYAEISDIINCSVTPAYMKPKYIVDHLTKSGLVSDTEQAKEFAKRSSESPLVARLMDNIRTY